MAVTLSALEHDAWRSRSRVQLARGYQHQGDASCARASLGRAGRSKEISSIGRGTKEVRSSEGDWSAKSARFHHTGGIWPLHLRDQTSVLESDRPKCLVLQAQVRPSVFHQQPEFGVGQCPSGRGSSRRMRCKCCSSGARGTRTPSSTQLCSTTTHVVIGDLPPNG